MKSCWLAFLSLLAAFAELEQEIAQITAVIAVEEQRDNQLVARLYGLGSADMEIINDFLAHF